MEQPEVVAAFDFDGTLSNRDNFVPFLRRVAGTGRRPKRRPHGGAAWAWPAVALEPQRDEGARPRAALRRS